MVPYNFEDNLKSKLEKRAIQPSDNSWEKLAEKLDEENKSNSKNIWWLGIAASIIGVLLVTIVYFDKIEATDSLPELVETPNEETKIKVNDTPESHNVTNSKKSFNEDKISVKEQSKTSIANKNTNKPTNKYLVRNTSKIAVATNNDKAENIQIEEVINENALIESEERQNSIVKNSEEKIDNQLDIDSEIELLLNNAQKEFAINNNKTKGTTVVNSNSLLKEVETDLEETFRDKVFKTVISSYHSVKTAVAERNN